MKLTINLLILTVYVKGELVTYTSVGHVFCLFLKFEKKYGTKNILPAHLQTFLPK